MFWIIVFLFFLIPSTYQYYIPISFQCYRKPGVWWERFHSATDRCEEFGENDDEECGVCTRDTYNERDTNKCFHSKAAWKFDFTTPDDKPSKKQACVMMDHCHISYAMKYRHPWKFSDEKITSDFVNTICGTEDDKGVRVQRGDCKSVYGTYVCECKQLYQGRNCNDLGPEGAYATGVQVLMDTKVRVSDMMSILIAVKTNGNDLKVRVNVERFDAVITITEPTIIDASSIRLIRYCARNTRLKKQCATYLEGSTAIYTVNLRFPLIRDERKLWYYTVPEDNADYPIGYMTNLIITTTNTINGVEKESFFRTNYDRAYTVYVEYPLDIGCYENVKIVNCKELQRKVNVYDASKEIVLYGDNPVSEIHEKITLSCSSIGDDAMKWKIFQVKPDGKFLNIGESRAKTKFKFVIPPYLFKNGNYLVEFSVAMGTKWDITENFDQCFFTVVEAPIIAIIEGGMGKYVDVDSVIILDGGRSYDPNVQEGINKEGLNFEWSCKMNKTGKTCLEDYISPRLGLHNYIKLPPSVLEVQEEYIITLKVGKIRKHPPVYATQTLFTGRMGNIQSIGIRCINCMGENIVNPTDHIYLLAQIVLKPNVIIDSLPNVTWTFSKHPIYPPVISADSIRINQTSQDLLKIDINKLETNHTYYFRLAILGNKYIFSEIDIHTPPLGSFTCFLTPSAGIVSVTDFTINCTSVDDFTYEVYDKTLNDANYFSGRMLFTGFDPNDNYFKLASKKVVVYGYDKYRLIQEWAEEVNLTPFDGYLKDIDDMVQKLEHIKVYRQRSLHSASVIAGALKPGMEWSSIDLLNDLLLLLYQVSLEDMSDLKLVLSSLEFILVTLSRNHTREEFPLSVEQGKMCADIIFALASGLFGRVKNFDYQVTLTEAILHQMIKSHLNVIEILLTAQQSQVFSKLLHFMNRNVEHLLKYATYKLVDALYKLSSSLIWRKIQGDVLSEIRSTGSKITHWARVDRLEEFTSLKRQNQQVPCVISGDFYLKMKSIGIIGIQVTNLDVNPFWWAGGDIKTNILLVDICFKVNLTQCKYRRTFYRAPIYLYFNISQAYNAIKPLDIHTVYLNLTKHPSDLDLDITVYRFDPPLRAKLLIQFEFENSTEDYKVLFSVNKRPDFDEMKKRGVTINNENQSSVIFLKYIKDDSDTLYYMGIYPIQSGSAEKKVNFKLKIMYAVCKTWLRWRWGSQRCWVGENETDEETLRCDCSHLSMFAGVVQVPHYTLNPGLEFMLFLTEELNWIPIVVLIIIIIVFIVLYLWGWLRDRKDSSKGIVTILEDNFPGDSYAYLIGVYTGSKINSSTESNVGIRLLGRNVETRAHILKNYSHPKLQSNGDDWFLLYCPVHLGTLESIHIWHDNSGKSPDWFVERIEVYDLTDKFEYVFELNIWLAVGVNEYPDAVVATSSIEDFYSVRRVFLSNVITGFRDTNYWTSVFLKHARNPVKRVLRISVVLCFIMVTIMCSVLLYHFNKGEDYEEDEPTYNLTYADMIIFVITLVVASLPTCAVMFLFRKSFSHRYVRMQSSLFLRPSISSYSGITLHPLDQIKKPSQLHVSKSSTKHSNLPQPDPTKPGFIELSYTKDERFIRFGLRSKLPSEMSMYERLAAAVHAMVRGSTLEPVRLPKYRSNVILHKKYFITAWILLIIIITAATVTLILFGIRIPEREGEKWVTIFLCVLFFDALILSTLKILVCSIILGCVFQRVVPASNYQLEAEDGMRKYLVGDKNHIYNLVERRSQPMYCPLNGALKELNRQKCVRREQWKSLVDFLVVLLLVLVLVVLAQTLSAGVYDSNTHAAWMLTQGPPLNDQNFTRIYNRTLFSNFLVNDFVDKLHRSSWYNQESPLNDNDAMRRRYWTFDCTLRLVGSARIRQLRVIQGECSGVSYFEDIAEFCSPSWSSGEEDTETYGSRWGIGSHEDLRRKSNAWRYTDPRNSNSSATQGQTRTVYPSGGYIEDLGFEKDKVVDALSNLIPQVWLDHVTRAVFVELTLYNVNTRLFSQVILVAEQMPTGEYLLTVNAESVTTDFTFNIWIFSFSVFLMFLLVRLCICINRRGLFDYCSQVINVFELFSLTLGLLNVLFYLKHATTSTNYFMEFQKNGMEEFFNFSNIFFYLFWSRTVLCILFVCAVIRMLIAMRFGRIYFTFYYTFMLSISWIVWLIPYFILYLSVTQRLVAILLNTFVSPYDTSLLRYYKDHSAVSCKTLVLLMLLLKYAVSLLSVAAFTYYYKLAALYKTVETDNFNYFKFLKVNVCKTRNHYRGS